MVVLLSWLLGSSLLFACFGVVAAPVLGMQPRARFGLRLAGGALAVVVLAVSLEKLADTGLVPSHDLGIPWLALSLLAPVLVPVICYRRVVDSGGPGPDGPGPDEPPPSPGPRGGGIPLPDADQSFRRPRDHHRPPMSRRGPRRRTQEPAPKRPGVRPYR